MQAVTPSRPGTRRSSRASSRTRAPTTRWRASRSGSSACPAGASGSCGSIPGRRAAGRRRSRAASSTSGSSGARSTWASRDTGPPRPPSGRCVSGSPEARVHRSLKLLLPAAAAALTVAAAAAPAAGARRAHVARPSAAVRGSVQPSVARSARLGKAVAAAPVRVSLVLRPQHAGLLRNMAAHASGGTALGQRMIGRLFRPSAYTQARVAAYMRARGFRPLGRGVLTMSFAGTVARAQRAFGVRLARYRLGDGTAYRAPTGAIHLPPALAPGVISVSGLSTLPLMQPLGLHRAPATQHPRVTVGDCPAADSTQTANTGSLQPNDLASANGYDSQALLNAGSDGAGENVA